jgi:hypothetical protein
MLAATQNSHFDSEDIQMIYINGGRELMMNAALSSRIGTNGQPSGYQVETQFGHLTSLGLLIFCHDDNKNVKQISQDSGRDTTSSVVC